MKNFPLLLFDGERESYVGDISIHPTYEYKPFQFMISSRIGVSPDQFTIYLIDRRLTPMPPFSENRRRIPVTGKVNFGFICNQTMCCFLVVMKRRRRSRYLREEKVEADDSFTEYDRSVADESNQPEQAAMQSRMAEWLPIQQSQEFVISWQNYLTSMADWNWRRQRLSDSLYYLDSRHGLREAEIFGGAWIQNSHPKVVFHCSECSDSDADTTSFHCCVNDPLIRGFYRSVFGPISRPKPNTEVLISKPDFVPFTHF